MGYQIFVKSINIAYMAYMGKKMIAKIRLFIKKTLFNLKYYINWLFKNFFRYLRTMGLFYLTIILFLMTMFPMLFKNYPMYYPAIFPKMYTIKGDVIYNNKKIKNYTIEVGGFKAKSDHNGNFSLNFLSKEKNNIPILFKTSEKEYYMRIDYNDTTEIDKNIILK